MWRSGLVIFVTTVMGCRVPARTEPPTGPDAADAGSSALPDAGPGETGAIDATVGDAGEAGQPLCSPLVAPSRVADVSIGGWSPPTAVPFSCAPMPNALFLPRPGPDVSGTYARCASFADARAISLAVNGNGSRVALVGIDGIARIVDVATQTVVGVLAPPRASVDLAAFSPDGKTILTVARGERMATLWRTDTFAPVWTTTLPGHTYDRGYTGAATFSPDGTAALVSPGETLYLLDTATGTIRVTPALRPPDLRCCLERRLRLARALDRGTHGARHGDVHIHAPRWHGHVAGPEDADADRDPDDLAHDQRRGPGAGPGSSSPPMPISS